MIMNSSRPWRWARKPGPMTLKDDIAWKKKYLLGGRRHWRGGRPRAASNPQRQQSDGYGQRTHPRDRRKHKVRSRVNITYNLKARSIAMPSAAFSDRRRVVEAHTL